jgi:glycerophosphoryl diester phosphodiesterase
MKNLFLIGILMISLFSFSSCGVNNALIANLNQNSTQVHLSSNNYRVIERVTGSAEVPYVLLIGGMNRSQLYENAYADMMSKANLMTDSRALINIVTEDHIGGVPPFYFKRTITVSAHVIEFTR